jgi:uncharacterized protein (DUF2147 family)
MGRLDARGRCLLAVIAAVAATGPGWAVPSVKTPTGLWESPGGNTRLRISKCGPNLCGKVAWASARAKADAARGGHPELIGMQLFEEFRRTGPETFEGRVFVPDINRRFNGRLTVTGPKTVNVRGCLLRNTGCRNETWRRISS